MHDRMYLTVGLNTLKSISRVMEKIGAEVVELHCRYPVDSNVLIEDVARALKELVQKEKIWGITRNRGTSDSQVAFSITIYCIASEWHSYLR